MKLYAGAEWGMRPIFAAAIASSMTTTVPVIFCPITVRSEANAMADKTRMAVNTAKCCSAGISDISTTYYCFGPRGNRITHEK